MLERLERILWALDNGQPLDDDLSNWLGQAINRHIREGVSLDKALNITGSRGKFLMDRRNYCLVKAAQVLEQNYPDQSIWQRAERLAELLARFSAVRWGRLEFKPEPDDLSALDRWLFRAMKTGQKPIGHNQVYNILLKNVGGSNFSNLVINFYHHNKLDNTSCPKSKDQLAEELQTPKHWPSGKNDTKPRLNGVNANTKPQQKKFAGGVQYDEYYQPQTRI